MSHTPPPPMAPTPPPVQQKKGRGCLWAALGALVVIVLLIGGCMGLAGGVANQVDKQQKAEHTLVYKVTTKGRATVMFGRGGGTSQQEITQDWTKEEKFTGWEVVSLTVHSDFSDPAGQVSCEILVDGKSAVKNSGSGQGASATCSASSLPS